MPEWMNEVTLAQAILTVAAISGIIAGLRRVWPFLTRLKNFFDDLMGEPERPGVPRHPGVMERLQAHEQAMLRQEEAMSAVHELSQQLVTNGGSSLRDAVNRIEASQQALSQRLETHVGTTADAQKALWETVSKLIDKKDGDQS